MSVKVMTLVWKRSHCCADPFSLVVMLALADWSNDLGESHPSMERLAEKCRQSVRNIRMIVRQMEADGYLTVTVKRGRSHTNIFQLDLQKLRDSKPAYREREVKPAQDASFIPTESDNERSEIPAQDAGLLPGMNAALSDSKPANGAGIKPAQDAGFAKENRQMATLKPANGVDKTGKSGIAYKEEPSWNRHGTVNNTHVESKIRPLSKSEKVPKSEVDEVFNYWRQKLNHPTSQLSPKRERKVRGRLANGFSVDQLKSAIDGCRASPHHQGENDTGTVYDDLELIARDAEHVEMFIAIAQRGKQESLAMRRVMEKIEREREMIADAKASRNAANNY